MMTSTSTITLSGTQIQQIILTLQGIADALKSQPFWNTQWFAAIVGAAIGMIPSFYLLYKDRPIIKVRSGHALAAMPPAGQIRNGFWASIANSGRRPITVNDFSLLFKDGSRLLFPSESLFVGGSRLPKILDEGNSHMVTIQAGVIADEVHKKGDYPVAACFKDAVGRPYKCDITREFWDNLFKVAAGEDSLTTA